MVSRYAAITRGGASARRIKTAAKETATTPINMARYGLDFTDSHPLTIYMPLHNKNSMASSAQLSHENSITLKRTLSIPEPNMVPFSAFPVKLAPKFHHFQCYYLLTNS